MSISELAVSVFMLRVKIAGAEGSERDDLMDMLDIRKHELAALLRQA